MRKWKIVVYRIVYMRRELKMIKKQVVIVSLLVILLSFMVIADGNLKIIAPSSVEANKDFNIDIMLNSNGVNVKSITLYITSESGKVTFKSSSRTGTVWLSTVAPTNDQAVMLDGKSVYNFKVGPAGSFKESSVTDKKVVTLTVSASQSDKIVVYKLNDAQGTIATKYPQGSLTLNSVLPAVFTVTAADPCAGITCPNKCEGTTQKTGGSCSNGVCTYASSVLNSVDCGYKVPSAPVCGNNKIESGEECDGTDVGGETCPTGKTGIVKCLSKSNCQEFDYSGCSPIVQQTTGNTIGQKIDEQLGAEKATKTWSVALLSKIANILKFNWFTN